MPFLYFFTFFVLKFILFDISIATPPFFLFPFPWVIFFNVYLSMLGGCTERKGDRDSQAGSVLSVQSPMWDSKPLIVRS